MTCDTPVRLSARTGRATDTGRGVPIDPFSKKRNLQ